MNYLKKLINLISRPNRFPKPVRSSVIATLFVLLSVAGNSQDISVKSFEVLPQDMDARINHPVKDQNGEKCALIKVVTDQQGFVWEGGMLGIPKVEKKTGEYWVYIPRGAKKITIKHDELGVLRDYVYPEAIKEATVYEMVLTTGEVKTVVEDPEISTVWVMINSEPTNADVYIDEDYLGQTPLQKKIKVGEHNYRIAKELYAPKAGKITLEEDQEREKLNITLNPNHGDLSIDSRPEQGAQVYIDGRETNKITPSTIEKLAVGSHTVTLRKEWFEPKSEKFTIEAGQEITKDMTMEPSFGKVSINTNPSARIYQDGEEIGSGTVEKRVMPGVYSFEAKKDKHHSAEETVEIQQGDSRELSLTLEPKYGTLEVTTEPWEATIQLNGDNYGKTPKTINELLIGIYRVTLEKEGYKTISKTIEIKENEDITLNEELISGKDITIQSNPEGGDVTIDGEKHGTTPVEARISYGKHEIEIEKGNTIAKETFKVKEDDKNSYKFPLRLKNHFYTSYSGSIYPKNTKYIAPYGIQIGMLGKFGWYLAGRLNEASLKDAAYEVNGEQVLNYPKDQYYKPTGTRNYPVLSVSGGMSFYLGKGFHFYAGGGYGVKKVYRYIDEFSYKNDEKVGEAILSDNTYTTKGIELEGGVMLHTNPVVFTIGWQTLNVKYSSIMFGIGITF